MSLKLKKKQTRRIKYQHNEFSCGINFFKQNMYGVIILNGRTIDNAKVGEKFMKAFIKLRG